MFIVPNLFRVWHWIHQQHRNICLLINNFFWAFCWLRTPQHLCWIFQAKPDIICSALWCWDYPYNKGTLPSCFLLVGNGTWWCWRVGHLQNWFMQSNAPGGWGLEQGEALDHHKLLESHKDPAGSRNQSYHSCTHHRHTTCPISNREHCCLDSCLRICNIRWNVPPWSWETAPGPSWIFLHCNWLGSSSQNHNGCWE